MAAIFKSELQELLEDRPARIAKMATNISLPKEAPQTGPFRSPPAIKVKPLKTKRAYVKLAPVKLDPVKPAPVKPAPVKLQCTGEAAKPLCTE